MQRICYIVVVWAITVFSLAQNGSSQRLTGTPGEEISWRLREILARHETSLSENPIAPDDFNVNFVGH